MFLLVDFNHPSNLPRMIQADVCRAHGSAHSPLPAPQIQQQISNWQYTLAKPVATQQPKINRTWRSSLDTRGRKDESPKDGGVGSPCSSILLRESVRSRSGYWKGLKVSNQTQLLLRETSSMHLSIFAIHAPL